LKDLLTKPGVMFGDEAPGSSFTMARGLFRFHDGWAKCCDKIIDYLE